MYAATSGYPYFTQAYGKSIWDLAFAACSEPASGSLLAEKRANVKPSMTLPGMTSSAGGADDNAASRQR